MIFPIVVVVGGVLYTAWSCLGRSIAPVALVPEVPIMGGGERGGKVRCGGELG